MSKPSEKAMRIAEHIVKSSGLSFMGMELTIKQVAELYDAEIEAQHRKTWALAIEAAVEALRNKYGMGHGRANTIIRALPCPPIEATKEK